MSESTQPTSSSTSTSSTGVSSGSRSLPQSFSQHLLSQADCEELFNDTLDIGSLDLYFLNTCDHYNKGQNIPLSLIGITCSDMDEAGVNLSFDRTTYESRTACPSEMDYFITSQTVNITLNLRRGWANTNIRRLIFPGEAVQIAGRNVYQITKASLYRRLPRYIVSAVPLGADPDPSVSGGFLFPNVILDPNTSTTLSYNPDSAITVPVTFLARFADGQNGALAYLYE